MNVVGSSSSHVDYHWEAIFVFVYNPCSLLSFALCVSFLFRFESISGIELTRAVSLPAALSTAQALASAPFSLPAPPAWVAHAKALQRIAVTNSVLLMRLAQLESEAAEAAEAAQQQANAEAATASGRTEPWRWRAHCDWSLSATFPVFHVTKQKTGAVVAM
jgi:hypothetical protein